MEASQLAVPVEHLQVEVPGDIAGAGADLHDRHQGGVFEPAHEGLGRGRRVAVAAGVGGEQGKAARPEREPGDDRRWESADAGVAIDHLTLASHGRVEIAGPDHVDVDLIAVRARAREQEPAARGQPVLIDAMIKTRVALVHGPLARAIGEGPDRAHAVEPDGHVLGVVELEALDAHRGVLIDLVLPPRVGVGVGEVDRLGPIRGQQRGLGREVAEQLGLAAQAGHARIAGVEIGRVPEREAKPERVGLIDHRLGIGEAGGFEVEAVDPARVGPIDPDRRGREIEVAQGLHVLLDLGLVVVLVAPDPRTERPASRTMRRAADGVVVAGDVERMLGAEQVEIQAGLARWASADRRGHAIVGALGHVEDHRVVVGDVHAPAAGAGDEGHRHVDLVVAALEREVELELERAHAAALLGPIEDLAEAIEALLRVDLGREPEQPERRAIRLGRPAGGEATRGQLLDHEVGPRAAFEDQRHFDPRRRVLDRLGRADDPPGVGLDEERVVAGAVEHLRDLAELKAIGQEAQQHVAASDQAQLGPELVPLEHDRLELAGVAGVGALAGVALARARLARAGPDLIVAAARRG